MKDEAEGATGRPAADRLVDLERENRFLARRLRRMEENVEVMQQLQDSNSTILSKLALELDAERARSERLLLNVLPQRVVDRLNAGEDVIADRFDSVTVLFADLVGFTPAATRLPPAVLIGDLNRIFTAFDAICAEEGIEKVKTIGDAYLAVGGLPDTAEDHVAAAAAAALRMRDVVASTDAPAAWRLRIGIHTGPVAAGIIGTTKFAYDIWGDTVNTASRLQTAAEPDRILVSGAVALLLDGRFALRSAGETDLKGKGRIAVFELGEPAASAGQG